jgi:hypothetical protein
MGVGSLGPTQADAAVFGEQLREGAGLKNVPSGVDVAGSAAPEGLGGMGGAASYIPYSPSTQKFWVGGRLVDATNALDVSEGSKLINQPMQPAPASVATDWVPMSPAAYGAYVSKLKTPRGFGANVALGARGLAEQTIGGVGDILTATGAPSVGEPIARFAESTFGQTKAEQARSALIQQSNSTLSNIWDAVAQGIPSAGFSLVSGGLGAVGGVAAATRAAGVAANIGRARTVGALTGLAASTYPSEFQNFYESAKNAKNPDGSPAYNLDDPSTRMQIAAAAGGTTLLQTLADGVIARGFSPFFKDAVVKAGERAASSRIGAIAAGTAEGAASEAFAEGATQLAQQAVFDPEFRRQLNASDWKALAPYVIEKYGESALIAAGAGAVLGGAFGGVGGVAAPLKPTNLLEGAGGEKPEAPTVGPQPGAQGELFPGAELGVAPTLTMQPTGETLAAARETDFAAIDERRRLEGLIAESNAQLEAAAAGAGSLDPVRISMLTSQIARAREAIASIDATGRLMFEGRSEAMARRLAEQPTLPFGQQNLLRGVAAAPPTTPAPTPTPAMPAQVGVEGLPLFGFPEGVLQTPPGEQIPLPLQGGAGVAPTPATIPVTTPIQLQLPLVETQTEMPLEGGVSRLRRGAQIVRQLGAQQIQSRAALAAETTAMNARREAAKATLLPVQPLEFTEAPTVQDLQGQRAFVAAEQRERKKLLGPSKAAMARLTQMAQAQGITYKEAERIIKGHINAGEKLLKQLDGYIADPTTIPVAPVSAPAAAPAPAPTPTAAPAPVAPAAVAAPTQPVEVPNAAQVGQIEQGGVGQYQGVGGQVPSEGVNRNVAPQVQEGGGETGGGNIPVEGGPQPEEVITPTPAGTKIGNLTVIADVDARFANYVSALTKALGFGNRKILFGSIAKGDLQRLVNAKSGKQFGITDTQLTVLKGSLRKYLLSTTTRGLYTRLGDGTDVILFNQDLVNQAGGRRYLLALEVIAHEIGHGVEFNAFANASPEVQAAIKSDFEKFLRKADPKYAMPTMAEWMRLLRTPQRAKQSVRSLGARGRASAGEMFKADPGYWDSFSEWFADQVSKWATTQRKPLTITERFFSTLGRLMNKLFDAGRKEGLPTQNVTDFLNGLGGPDFSEILGIKEDTTPPGGGGIAPMEDTATTAERRSTDESIRQFVAGAVPAPMQSAALSIARNIRDGALKFSYGMSFGRDLVDWISPMLPAVKNYFDFMINRMTLTNKLRQEVDQIMLQTGDLGDARKPLNEFLAKSTIDQVWGYQPTWINKAVTIDPDAKAQYDALPENARRVADQIFEHGFKTSKRMRQAIVEKIRGELTGPEYASLPADVKQQRQEDVARRLQLMSTIFKEREGPYAPLSRFGQFVTVGKSARFRELENIPAMDRTPEEKEELETLRADPDSYIVIFSESLGAAMQKQEELKAQFPDMFTEAFERQLSPGKVDVPAWLNLQRIKTLVEKDLAADLQPQEIERINQLITDLYIGTLAENSARRHQLARTGVAGYDDMLRAFATKGTADAHFIASMTNDSDVANTLEEMSRQARMSDEEAAAAGIDGSKADRMRALNEVLRRHVQGLTYTPTPLQDKLMAFNSMWTLLTLPRYYLQNATQTYMLSLPYMAAKFGYGRTSDEINRTYKELGTSLFKNKGDFNKFMRGEFDIARMRKLDGSAYSKEEQDVLTTLRDNGLLDIGMGYDLGYWETFKSSGPQKALQDVMHKLTALTRQVEVANRVTAGMAAYRLAKADGRSNQQALNYAAEVLSQTQGDYSSLNAPRYFNAFAFSKVVTQFRKYQVMQASLLIRNGYNMFAGASKEERAIARAVMRNVIGQTAVFTGALGLPLATLMSYILAAIFGPPDEPVNEERFLRQIIGDGWLADTILKGVPAGLGVDVSGQLGLGNVFSPLPYTDVDLTSREGLGRTLLGVGGPLMGTAANFADGMGMMAQGDYWKGVEFMMPNGIKSAMRAYRETFDKGVTRRNGDLVVSPEEFTLLDSMLQGLGFTSTNMANVRRKRQEMYEYDKYFSERTTEVRRDFVEAQRAGDSSGVEAAKSEWLALQSAKKRVGLKPSAIANLKSAPKQQTARERRFAEQFKALTGEQETAD